MKALQAHEAIVEAARKEGITEDDWLFDFDFEADGRKLVLTHKILLPHQPGEGPALERRDLDFYRKEDALKRFVAKVREVAEIREDKEGVGRCQTCGAGGEHQNRLPPPTDLRRVAPALARHGQEALEPA